MEPHVSTSSIVLRVALGLAFFAQGAIAAPQQEACLTATATVTITWPHPLCLGARRVCLIPSSTCSPGQPTGPTPPAPIAHTVAPPSDCVEYVVVQQPVSCGLCATCVSAHAPNTSSAVQSRSPVSSGGHFNNTTLAHPTTTLLTHHATTPVARRIPTPLTRHATSTTLARRVSNRTSTSQGHHSSGSCRNLTTVTAVSSLPRCFCPLSPRSCPPGEAVTTPPLPISTVTEACTVRKIIKPGCQCPACEPVII